MRDHAVAHADLADRHLPLVRRRLQQHDARGGGAAPNVVFGAADTAAASGAHLAPDAFAGEVLAGRGKFRPHVGPPALEFFGDELRESGFGPLPHLGACDTDHAGIVGTDDDPGIDFGAGLRRAPAFGGSHSTAVERKRDAER